MKFLIGTIITILFIIGPYIEMGGSLLALLQPAEALIIIGSGIGSFIIANSRHVIFTVLRDMKYAFRGLPATSAIFNEYPLVLKNQQATNFFCDYMRLISMGFDDYYQLDDLMQGEIEVINDEWEGTTDAINSLGESSQHLAL